MKNTEILGLTNPLPQRAEPTPEQERQEAEAERQQILDERAQFEKDEFERLAKGGADYRGMETIRALMGRMGRI